MSHVIAKRLLTWFDQATLQATARPMPWREIRDPYRVLLSEFMLQQTQVTTVIPYYEKFLKVWPTIVDLAGADEQTVLKAWEGLGYYSRARNLLATARLIVERHQGIIPATEPDLLQLKGIGDYTAGAIRSIAFNLPAPAVDGNVVRVAARLTCTAWDPTDIKQRREVKTYIASILPGDRPGDFNEALMDLGATVCLPKTPRCGECPLASVCQAQLSNTVPLFPAKKPKKAAPIEQRTCLIFRCGPMIHVNRRPEKGLLAGLFEFDWAV
ncbi:MAG: A/G-specific adenine glycosylase, partial [Eubacteriales bacterium]|nr:A/G-specific adenine glycosylase [Eubacteriales bacterium]